MELYKLLPIIIVLPCLLASCAWTTKDWGKHTAGAVATVATSYALGFDPVDGGSYSVLEWVVSETIGEVTEYATETIIENKDNTNEQTE